MALRRFQDETAFHNETSSGMPIFILRALVTRRSEPPSVLKVFKTSVSIVVPIQSKMSSKGFVHVGY